MLRFLSPAWFALFVFDILFAVAFGVFFKGKDEEKARRIMLGIAIFNAFYWVLYKFMISLDVEYVFIFFEELPLHLCNINTILLIVALSKKNQTLMSFCFCFGTLGALLAIMTPDPFFVEVHLFSSRGAGYWIYHHLLLAQCIALVTSGLYKPQYSHLKKTVPLLFGIYLAMYPVNLLIRAITGANANYLYTFGMEGNPLTGMLYKLIPVYPLFMIPAVIPLSIIALFMLWLARLGSREA